MVIAEELITEEQSGKWARHGLDEQNKGTAGRILVTGSIAEATGRAGSLLCGADLQAAHRANRRIPPFLSAYTPFVMSLAGHQTGRTIAGFIPRIRTDLLTGIAFLLMAGLVVAGVADS